MLDFNLKVDVDVSKTQFPIYFERKNICVHCGCEGSLKFVDKYGRETDKEIHALDHIRCVKCGTRYSILWNRDEKTGRMYPSAVDPSIKQEFVNLFLTKQIKPGDRSLE